MRSKNVSEKKEMSRVPVKLTDVGKTISSLRLTKRYRSIRKDLLDQLERNSTVGQYYHDLIEDYMDMWIEKSLAMADINERGVIVEYNNGGGQAGMKKNDSVELKLKLNAQMLKILSELGIKPSQGEGGDDEL